jgi:pimeloyl-ACP methyl ester carboxylesterase
MIERVDKLAFDFAAALAEENVAISARALRVPTLLFSGGLSPCVAQRTVELLTALIDGAETLHLPAAGHMLPISHASAINPRIVRHIMRFGELVSPLTSRQHPKSKGRSRLVREVFGQT